MPGVPVLAHQQEEVILVQSAEIPARGEALRLPPILPSLTFPASKTTLPSFTPVPLQQEEKQPAAFSEISSAKEEGKGE